MLKTIRRWLSIIFIVASVLLAFWVYEENTGVVDLVLFGFALNQKPLGLLIIITFVSGIMLGLFCNILATSWMIFKMKRLQKQIQNTEIRKPERSL